MTNQATIENAFRPAFNLHGPRATTIALALGAALLAAASLPAPRSVRSHRRLTRSTSPTVELSSSADARRDYQNPNRLRNTSYYFPVAARRGRRGLRTGIAGGGLGHHGLPGGGSR